MKRYESDDCRACMGLVEDPRGDWVKYEDARAERTDLIRLLHAMWRNAEPPNSTEPAFEAHWQAALSLLQREGLL